MTTKKLILRALKLWLGAALTALSNGVGAALALAAVHRLRDGGWGALPADLGWAALVAAVVVSSQRWHAARGAQCAMCVDAPESDQRRAADHV